MPATYHLPIAFSPLPQQPASTSDRPAGARLAEKTVTLNFDEVQATFDRVAIARVERDEAPAQAKA